MLVAIQLKIFQVQSLILKSIKCLIYLIQLLINLDNDGMIGVKYTFIDDLSEYGYDLKKSTHEPEFGGKECLKRWIEPTFTYLITKTSNIKGEYTISTAKENSQLCLSMIFKNDSAGNDMCYTS